MSHEGKQQTAEIVSHLSIVHTKKKSVFIFSLHLICSIETVGGRGTRHLPRNPTAMLTTEEECSVGVEGGCRRACRVEPPPFIMLRWASDSVRSDSPSSEERNARSPLHGFFSSTQSGWYLGGQMSRV